MMKVRITNRGIAVAKLMKAGLADDIPKADFLLNWQVFDNLGDDADEPDPNSLVWLDAARDIIGRAQCPTP